MSILVVGSGFLGSALAVRRPDSIHTSRDPAARSSDRHWLRFDVSDPTSWTSLDGRVANGVVVTAPMGSDQTTEALWGLLSKVSSKVVVVGTTSAFGPTEKVSDDSAIDPGNPRAMAEERLRALGATVIHAAGIYGPGRNPLDWVRRQRITDAGRLVNLIHVDDLARACLFLIATFEAGLRVVCSDGTPRRWSDIIAEAAARGWIVDPHLADEGGRGSRAVMPRALADRGFRIEHDDLFAELHRLERGNSVAAERP